MVATLIVGNYISFNSKRRQKAINIERRKQTLRKLRVNTSKPSAVNSNEGRVPTQNTTDESVSMTVTHEDTRKKRRRKHKTERSYVNNEQQEQFENDEEQDFARKRKKKARHAHSKHQRLEGRTTLELAVPSGQRKEGERERVPTPIPVHRSLNTNTDLGKSFAGEPRERKHRKKTKKKKTRSELREFDEGFDEGSETRQTGNSEDSLIKSLPRPRQLAPLQERSPATIQL